MPIALQNRYARLASEWATFASALTEIGATPTTLILPLGWSTTLAVNTTIPATLRLEARGGVITTGTFSLTINGPFDCGPFQCFSGTGVVFGPGSCERVLPQWWGATTSATNNGVALQAWIDACSHAGNPQGQPHGYLPPGAWHTTVALQFKLMFVHIEGAGMQRSYIYFDNVVGSYITAPAIDYFRPTLRNFSIDNSGTSTGKGLDFTAVNFHTYEADIKCVYVNAQGNAADFRAIFSSTINTLWTRSTNGHGIVAWCGPAVSWMNCYALDTPATGKAGYRLAGTIEMYSCNGVNSADYWGVFGNDTASGDGFQSDFAVSAGLALGIDYPVITLHGCNIEEFTKCGVRIQAPFVQCVLDACKIDRSALTSAYHSLIHARNGSSGAVVPIRVGASIYIGTGVPNGGASLTEAWLYASAGATFMDPDGQCAVVGITKYYVAGDSVYYPLPKHNLTVDVYSDTAWSFHAVTARRLSVQAIRYYMPADLTPVGANQNIDVTGFTKVKITPAAAASVQAATFTSSPGAGNDYDRNGDLIIEAGNANLTIIHNFGAGDGFRLLGGVNLAMATGQIVRFMRSTNYLAGTGGWVQV